MAYLRVAGRATVCESHHECGKEWKNQTGRILMITRKLVVLDMKSCVIHVPKKKVVAV
jgi:hypothetical protein